MKHPKHWTFKDGCYGVTLRKDSSQAVFVSTLQELEKRLWSRILSWRRWGWWGVHRGHGRTGKIFWNECTVHDWNKWVLPHTFTSIGISFIRVHGWVEVSGWTRFEKRPQRLDRAEEEKQFLLRPRQSQDHCFKAYQWIHQRTHSTLRWISIRWADTSGKHVWYRDVNWYEFIAIPYQP